MNKIFMNKYKQEMTNAKWHTCQTESRYIEEEEFNLITKESVVAFFIMLGGTERIYRRNGKIVKLVSTNPDKSKRCVYEFEHG